jgi:hypothetical protein
MKMRSALRIWAASAVLVGLAACGDSGSDTKVVEKCVAGGGKRESCRCVDRVFRAELTGEEYQKLEGLMTSNQKPPGDLKALLELTSKDMGQGPKGLEATMAFYMKLGTATQKILKACGPA